VLSSPLLTISNIFLHHLIHPPSPIAREESLTMSLLVISFLSMMLSRAALVSGSPAPHMDGCTFWTDSTCQTRSSHLNYNPESGIIQNDGAYFSCDGVRDLSLISYAPGDLTGISQENCYVFPSRDSNSCLDLESLNFRVGDRGYYRITSANECLAKPSTRDVQRNSTTQASTVYLRFYNDAGCTQQSGSVGYSSKNQGCFENGGAYAALNTGEDRDWHLEQWSGIDNFQCADTRWKCATAHEIFDRVGCVHLDDLGFHTGFGSYLIGRGGC